MLISALPLPLSALCRIEHQVRDVLHQEGLRIYSYDYLDDAAHITPSNASMPGSVHDIRHSQPCSLDAYLGFIEAILSRDVKCRSLNKEAMISLFSELEMDTRVDKWKRVDELMHNHFQGVQKCIFPVCGTKCVDVGTTERSLPLRGSGIMWVAI